MQFSMIRKKHSHESHWTEVAGTVKAQETAGSSVADYYCLWWNVVYRDINGARQGRKNRIPQGDVRHVLETTFEFLLYTSYSIYTDKKGVSL
jgi:hypothetical protein